MAEQKYEWETEIQEDGWILVHRGHDIWLGCDKRRGHPDKVRDYLNRLEADCSAASTFRALVERLTTALESQGFTGGITPEQRPMQMLIAEARAVLAAHNAPDGAGSR